jgi:hypothetical protein
MDAMPKPTMKIVGFASRAPHLASVEKCHDGIFQQADRRRCEQFSIFGAVVPPDACRSSTVQGITIS